MYPYVILYNYYVKQELKIFWNSFLLIIDEYTFEKLLSKKLI